MGKVEFDIVSGIVTEVQLAPERYEAPAPGRDAPEGHITNRMRIFIRDGAEEDDYDVDDDEIGVRDGHSVVLARARDAHVREPVNLLLFNVSTDERREFARNFALFTDRPALFGPRWKATGAAALFFLAAFAFAALLLWPEAGMAAWITWPLIWTILVWPVFWAAAWAWDAITRPIRAERARNAMRAEIEARLAAHLAAAPSAADAPRPDTA